MITITNIDIINYCGKSSFDKGQACADIDSFIKIFVQEDVLLGLYQGSVGVYRITITFNNNVPCYSWCTCPAMGQYDDQCKHIAGLMILWNKQPKNFVELESWKSLLKDKSKESLIKLIMAVASKSMDVTSAFHEELKGEALLDEEELYDPNDEW